MTVTGRVSLSLLISAGGVGEAGSLSFISSIICRSSSSSGLSASDDGGIGELLENKFMNTFHDFL